MTAKDYDIALRPDTADDPDLMDDIVVNNVTMFRAEQMDQKRWWVACYLRNNEEIVFEVRARSNPLRLEWRVQDRPDGDFVYEHQEGQ